jgi:hypothetical protein
MRLSVDTFAGTTMEKERYWSLMVFSNEDEVRPVDQASPKVESTEISPP